MAAADDALVRGAFGSGTLLASSTTRSGDAPVDAGGRARAVRAAAFGTGINAGRDQLCDIAVTAQPRAGWVSRRWAPQSNRCAGATNPVCMFRTREVDCDDTGENCTVNEPGPFPLIAEFADRRAPTVQSTSGPRAGETVFDDARRVAFAFTTDENEEAPTFRCGLDAGPQAACASPHTLAGVPDGLHVFSSPPPTRPAGRAKPPRAAPGGRRRRRPSSSSRARRRRRPQPLRRSPTAPTKPGTRMTARRRASSAGSMPARSRCDGVRAPFPRVSSVVSVSGTATAKATRFTRLLVTGVPASGKVELRCSGPCPFKRRSLPVRKSRANGARRSPRSAWVRQLEVRVTAHR